MWTYMYHIQQYSIDQKFKVLIKMFLNSSQ